MTLRRFLSGSVCAGLMVGLPALPAADTPAESPAAGASAAPAVEVNHDRPADRAFRVRLNADGMLSGTVHVVGADGAVAPASNLTLSFMSGGQVPAAWDGGEISTRVAAVADAGAEGRYTLSGLTPGLYSVTGRGPEGYVAFALQVLPAGGAETGEFDVLAAPPKDVATVAALATRYVPENGKRAELSAAAAQAAAPEAAAPARPANYTESDDLAGTAAALKRPTLKVGPNGTLEGHLVALYDGTGLARPFSEAKVFLLRDGEVAARLLPNAEGEYQMTGLTNGVYTVAALSRTGVSTVAFEAEVVGDEVAAADASPFRRVALQQPRGGFVSTVVPPIQGGFARPVAGIARVASGGTAGGGGGGGLGAALLIGGIAAAIAIAVSDDDDDDEVAPAASPAAPQN